MDADRALDLARRVSGFESAVLDNYITIVAQALTITRPFEGLARSATQLWRRARRLWRTHPRELAGLGLFALIIAIAAGIAALSSTALPRRAQAAPPAPPPLILRQIAPEQAVRVNAGIPVAQGPNPAATPFVFHGTAAARNQALQCLASAVYYEAGNQDADGQRAVAQVVLNRVRHPAFPASVCNVVYQGSTRPTGCQFTFTCDGSLYRPPDGEGWREAYQVAEAALAGSVYAPVGWATHYHADYVVPYWASTLAKNAVVGAHIFYRWAGAWGQPAVFTKAYSGFEPNAATLRSAALAVVHVTPLQAGSIAAQIAKIPGAEALPLTPSMRGDKRVAVRFNLVARKAADQAPHKDYLEKFAVSDNLRWSLSSDVAAGNEKPLGKAEPTSTAGNSGSASTSH
jgi:spore germination cell wall hydrolase CwlJ-like protein